MDFILENVDISELSNFKTKATARYFYEFNSIEKIDEVRQIIDNCRQKKIPYIFVSSGTNMLFAFDKFDWFIIKISLYWWDYSNWNLLANSSEVISDLAQKIEDYWNKTWHRFIGLPWSVWWAVYWNAGCFGLEIQHNFVSGQFLKLDNLEVVHLSRMNMDFEYRSSILKKTKNYLFLSGVFDLNHFEEKYSSDVDNIYFREHKQPKGNSCGSFFKNPPKDSAWRMIEAVWLKWYKIWWAFFSPLHANFLMSDWTASHRDLLDLIKLAQDKVKDEFWVDLEPEVQILKNR